LTGYVVLSLIALILIAAILRDNFAFTLLYLFAGVFVLSRWWTRRALNAVGHRRDFMGRAFFGEKVRVRLEVFNRGWLPVVWLRVNESLPVNLASNNTFQRVIFLGPKERRQFEYSLTAWRRGVYQLGPVFLYSGDVMGFFKRERVAGTSDQLTVFPRIVPLRATSLPSQSPLGSIPHHQPIFEDPSRSMGKRDYVSGDSLRRVDWKASATSGRLQVRVFEPSIALSTALFLNLDPRDYFHRTRIDATELAVVVAASLANWVVEHKQSVALFSNGRFPSLPDPSAVRIPPKKGRGHLIRILETLAQVTMAEGNGLADLLRQESVHLPWGTTLIIVTGAMGEALFDELFRIRRRGQTGMIVLVGPVRSYSEAYQRSARFGFPLHHIHNEEDLERWRI
jgi:uncharacterized protein (DUF58 family)